MTNRYPKILFSFVLSILIFCSAKVDAKVLILHSYHETFSWVIEINKAIESILDEQGIEYRYFYMDTKRKTDEAWKNEIASKAITVIEHYKPTVVIASDDNAQQYVGRSYVNNSNIQLVFCGVNGDINSYGYSGKNVTGILERPYPAQALHVLRTLVASINQVAIVSDNSPSAKLVSKQIKATLREKAPDVSVHSESQVSTFADWKKVIKRLDRDSRVDALMITVYHTIRDHDSKLSVEAKSVLNWAVKNTNKPIVGLWPHLILNGGFLAVTVKPSEHGKVAARMAVDIIKGKDAKNIPVKVNIDGKVMVNLLNNQHIAYDASVDIDQIADVVIRE